MDYALRHIKLVYETHIFHNRIRTAFVEREQSVKNPSLIDLFADFVEQALFFEHIWWDFSEMNDETRNLFPCKQHLFRLNKTQEVILQSQDEVSVWNEVYQCFFCEHFLYL